MEACHAIFIGSYSLSGTAPELRVTQSVAYHSCVLCRRRACIRAIPDRRRVSAALGSAHRKAGWVYAIAVFIGGIAAILFAFHAAFGATAASGFFILAVLWITVTAIAVRMAWKRRFDRQRIWMLTKIRGPVALILGSLGPARPMSWWLFGPSPKRVHGPNG